MLVNPNLKTILFRPIVPQGLCLLFAGVIIWQVIFFYFGYLKITASKQNAAIHVVIKKSENQLELDAMLGLPLFGEYIPKQFGDMTIKKSNLNLHVVGILFSKRQRDSHVILRSENGMEQTFKIGDTIPGGAVIKQISADGVLLAHDGELESLFLPKNELIFDALPKELKQLK